MNESRHREETIFEAATQLALEQRAAYLKEVCGDDADLRKRVERLLEVHDRGSSFMEEPALSAGSKRERRPILISEKPGDRIGRYKLLQQIGEGGCGIVYMAEQEEPVRRRVALKVIKLGMDTKNVIARFEAERQALALMDHPNIAKVFDAGATETGRPFFVMELVRGAKITEFCDEKKLSTKERLQLFSQVCVAIQHAHQKGVIHRDIKPSNILVTLRDGVPVPKVIDFGIAKATTDQRLTDKTVFTAFEQFIGTPAYMSPEQADLNEAGVDTRSDVYSLGVLLYELLTGLTPFDSARLRQAGLDGIRRIIREEEPVTPSTRLTIMESSCLTETASLRGTEPTRLTKLIRGELDWIVMKALEKDRGRRYATANGLAQDLERYLADEPVLARPASNLYRMEKLFRRNRLAVTATVAVFCALVIGLGISLREYTQKSKAEREQNRLRLEAQVQELAARRKAYAEGMNLVQQALEVDNLGRATRLLNQQRPKPGEEDLRGWEWRYLWQACTSDADSTVCGINELVSSIDFSPDGTWLAVSGESGAISLHQVHGTNEIRPTLHLGNIASHYYSHAVFSPGTNHLLAYPEQDEVVIWDYLNQREARRLRIGDDLVNLELQFLSGSELLIGRLFVTNNVSRWNVETGKRLSEFDVPMNVNGLGTRLIASRDGKRLAYSPSDKAVCICPWESPTNGWCISAAEELVTAFALSPDGNILATGGGYTEGAVKLWNVQTRQYIGALDGHRSWITSLEFLSNELLASASADQTIRLWNVTTLRPLKTLRGHNSEVRSLALSMDGQTLASGGKDGTVLLWNLSSTKPRPAGWRLLGGNDNPATGRYFQVSPDSRLIAIGDGNAVQVFDSITLKAIKRLDMGFTNKVRRIFFSPNSKLLASVDSSGALGVWDFTANRVVTNFLAHGSGGGVLGSGFESGGNRLMTYGLEGVGKEWDTVTWKETARWQLESPYNPVPTVYSASSTEGTLAYKCGDNPIMHILKIGDFERHREVPCLNRMVDIAFSPDGRTLVGANEDGGLVFWDAESLTNFATLRDVLLGLHSVSFSPDGQRIVAGGDGREAIKIWDAVSHEVLATLEGKGSLFSGAKFSADGNLVVARNWNGLLHVWRAPSWAEIEAKEESDQSKALFTPRSR